MKVFMVSIDFFRKKLKLRLRSIILKGDNPPQGVLGESLILGLVCIGLM